MRAFEKCKVIITSILIFGNTFLFPELFLPCTLSVRHLSLLVRNEHVYVYKCMWDRRIWSLGDQIHSPEESMRLFCGLYAFIPFAYSKSTVLCFLIFSVWNTLIWGGFSYSLSPNCLLPYLWDIVFLTVVQNVITKGCKTFLFTW